MQLPWVSRVRYEASRTEVRALQKALVTLRKAAKEDELSGPIVVPDVDELIQSYSPLPQGQ